MNFFRDMAVVVPSVWAISFAVNGPVSDTLRALIIAFTVCLCYFLAHHFGVREGVSATKAHMIRHMRSVTDGLRRQTTWDYQTGIRDMDVHPDNKREDSDNA